MPAEQRCSRLPPPEHSAQNTVPRSRHEEARPARSESTRPVPVSACQRTDLRSLRISSCRLSRHDIRCIAFRGSGPASTCDLLARDPRLTSHCRCRGNALRAFLELLRSQVSACAPGGRGLIPPRARHSMVPLPAPRQESTGYSVVQEREKVRRVSPAGRGYNASSWKRRSAASFSGSR
jgi:hypothetical protein